MKWKIIQPCSSHHQPAILFLTNPYVFRLSLKPLRSPRSTQLSWRHGSTRLCHGAQPPWRRSPRTARTGVLGQGLTVESRPRWEGDGRRSTWLLLFFGGSGIALHTCCRLYIIIYQYVNNYQNQKNMISTLETWVTHQSSTNSSDQLNRNWLSIYQVAQWFLASNWRVTIIIWEKNWKIQKGNGTNNHSKKKSYHRNKKFVNVSKNELKSKIGHETPSFGTSCPMASRFFSKSRNRSHVHHSHFYNIYTCGEYGHQYMRGSA